ncbi:hypothetical protein C8J57DRAFT_1301054 [Mycena rebaudengoi]|nr:hypothetical protein C8J57DRAFT_1301054 [Mycena rebaudengoi]
MIRHARADTFCAARACLLRRVCAWPVRFLLLWMRGCSGRGFPSPACAADAQGGGVRLGREAGLGDAYIRAPAVVHHHPVRLFLLLPAGARGCRLCEMSGHGDTRVFYFPPAPRDGIIAACGPEDTRARRLGISHWGVPILRSAASAALVSLVGTGRGA